MAIDLGNPVVSDALRIYKEAVQYRIELKSSHAYTVLHETDGGFEGALANDSVNLSTKEWLRNLRDALLEDMY